MQTPLVIEESLKRLDPTPNSVTTLVPDEKLDWGDWGNGGWDNTPDPWDNWGDGPVWENWLDSAIS